MEKTHRRLKWTLPRWLSGSLSSLPGSPWESSLLAWSWTSFFIRKIIIITSHRFWQFLTFSFGQMIRIWIVFFRKKVEFDISIAIRSHHHHHRHHDHLVEVRVKTQGGHHLFAVSSWPLLVRYWALDLGSNKAHVNMNILLMVMTY